MNRVANALIFSPILRSASSTAASSGEESPPPLRGGGGGIPTHLPVHQTSHLLSISSSPNSNKLKECLSHTDSASCSAAQSCEWCEVHNSAGLCMPAMYAEMAQCSKWQDMDTECIVSAVDGDDPRSSCERTTDQQGGKCIWCHGFGAGICLDEVQVESAKKILWCGDGKGEEAGAVLFATE